MFNLYDIFISFFTAWNLFQRNFHTICLDVHPIPTTVSLKGGGGSGYGAPNDGYGVPAAPPSYNAPAPKPSYNAPAPKPSYNAPAPKPSYNARPSYGGGNKGKKVLEIPVPNLPIPDPIDFKVKYAYLYSFSYIPRIWRAPRIWSYAFRNMSCSNKVFSQQLLGINTTV